MTTPRADSAVRPQRGYQGLAMSIIAALLVAACDVEIPVNDAGARERCGDGVRGDAEQCDGEDWAVSTCEELSPAFLGGTLRCDRRTCAFDTQDCVAVVPSHCGDGVIEGDEECEPEIEMEGPSCEDLGSEDSCATECNIQTCRWVSRRPGYPSAASGCGDGTVAHFPYAEECDGSNLDGLTCQNLKTANGYYSGGALSCDDRCQLDTLRCIGPNGERCGNGIREPGEACDGLDIAASCNLLNGQVGYYTCRPDCGIDRSNCVALCNNRFGIGLCF